MRVAISTWNGRISPVFDVSRIATVLEVDSAGVVSKREIPLEEDPIRKVAQIVEADAAAFLCGAVSRPFAEMLAARGVRLHPFLAGDVEEVVRAFLDGTLDSPRYAMPGCPGRRARAGRNGPCGRRRKSF